MARALALAEKRPLYATPNPRVGCVIVNDGDVIGEGWHERAAKRTRKSTRSARRKRAAAMCAGDALFDARAVQSRRPDGALRRGGDSRWD
jgi:pyrimidine deaminase RibD-like protein